MYTYTITYYLLVNNLITMTDLFFVVEILVLLLLRLLQGKLSEM